MLFVLNQECCGSCQHNLPVTWCQYNSESKLCTAHYFGEHYISVIIITSHYYCYNYYSCFYLLFFSTCFVLLPFLVFIFLWCQDTINIIASIVIFINFLIFFLFLLLIVMYWGSSWGSSEVFQPNWPYYTKMGACPIKTVEWPSHLCEIWCHCASSTSHTQFRWLGMVKGWCIAPGQHETFSILITFFH